jgi:hypothetical protein
MRHWQPLPESLEPETRNLVVRMRCLKEQTGMSLVELAKRTAHSKSAWHRYLNGTKFPPRSAVEALGRLTQVDEHRLLDLWTRAQWVRTQPESPPRQASPTPDSAPLAHTLPQRRTSISALATLILAAAAVAWVTVDDTPSHTRNPAPAPTTAASLLSPEGSAAPASCHGESCEGQYPTPSGCARDARTESTTATSGYSVRLRYSPSCATVWAEVSSTIGHVREISIKVKPKDELSDPPSDSFPTSSPMLAATNPQAAEACATVGENLACTGAGGQETSPG